MILTHMHECETDLWYNLDVFCDCLNGYCHYIEEICLESVLDFTIAEQQIEGVVIRGRNRM